MLDISKQKIKTSCPNCHSEIIVTLKQISDEETVKCHACQIDINLIDNENSAEKAIKNINKSFSDIEKMIKKIGK